MKTNSFQLYQKSTVIKQTGSSTSSGGCRFESDWGQDKKGVCGVSLKVWGMHRLKLTQRQRQSVGYQ